ncbi:hypothetical protein O998_01705 [Anaplasma phagocytophilum str. Norway variant1]|uniref:Uncharacterized protein n=1 Tax=Anaplasma phagocytophilum str. Norway variant1 TaxID=1392506 RepID=A0A7H9DYJ3_ANAPH|nr:hypothetical protein [Anaplasma phagocytophilum]QLL66575.1 hypothetical protein O998_01705 [Anaplasma phagocytophilum str. Norway variant1]
MRFRVAVLPLEHVLGITLSRCYTIRVLCCVNNNTIWNLEVPQYGEELLSRDWKYLDRGQLQMLQEMILAAMLLVCVVS